MLSYSFSNLCGATYRGGNVIFTSDGNSIISPVDNRVNVYDLVNNRSFTLGCESRKNIRILALSPDNRLLLTIDIDGHALLINFIKGIILHRMNFKTRVFDAKFSPCGKFIAVTNNHKIDVWEAPSLESGWQMARIRSLSGHVDSVLTVDWSCNSRYIVSASKDMSVRIHCRTLVDEFIPVTFVSHRSPVRGAYFSADMSTIYSVSEEGVIIAWEWKDGKPETAKDNAGRALGSTALLKKQRLKQAAHRGQHEFTDENGNKYSLHRETADIKRGVGALDYVFAQDDKSVSDKGFDLVGGFWTESLKAYCNQGSGNAKWAKVSRCVLNKDKNLLLCSFSNGKFTIYEVPTLAALHSVSVGGEELDCCALTPDGEWVAVASSQSSTLVVWEWQSETYILKQQGHHHGITSVAYSPAGAGNSSNSDIDVRSKGAEGGGSGATGTVGAGAGHLFATGGQDGKVKLWSSQSGFCFATFNEHSGPILDLCFTPQGNAILSASSDGTIRAFDLLRYRNFRTFAAPDEGHQFGCVAVDGGGEIVLGATQGESPKIFVWSMQTGKLLETLSGHEASISQLAFNPHPAAPGVFASASWDNTVRVWDILGRMNKGGAPETFEHTTMVAAIAWDPRANRQFATSTMGGMLVIWDAQTSDQLGEISGLRDIRSGRKTMDKMPANNSKGQEPGTHVGKGIDQNQFFSSITYAPTGQFLLAGSRNSPRVCIYDVDNFSLVRVVQLTQNWSLDGILLELNSKMLNEAGIADDEYALTDSEDEADKTNAKFSRRVQEAKSLPGTKTGELARAHRKEVLSVYRVAFSLDGREWAAATSHGVFTYSVDLLGQGGQAGASASANHAASLHAVKFAPLMLTKNVSVNHINEAINNKRWSVALVTALALNDLPSLLSVFHITPVEIFPLIVQGVSVQLLPALLNFIRILLQPSPTGSVHLQASLIWLSSTIDAHLHILNSLPTAAASSNVNSYSNDAVERKKKAQDNLEEALIKRSGSSLLDTRTLFLLLLRQLQHMQNVTGRLFANNARTVAFLMSAGEAETRTLLGELARRAEGGDMKRRKEIGNSA